MSPINCLYIDGILKVHSCAYVKSPFNVIWNTIWHLCKRRIGRHTKLFFSWSWMLTITHCIWRMSIGLIRGVNMLSPYRLKTGWLSDSVIILRSLSLSIWLSHCCYAWISSSRAMIFILCAMSKITFTSKWTRRMLTLLWLSKVSFCIITSIIRATS